MMIRLLVKLRKAFALLIDTLIVAMHHKLGGTKPPLKWQCRDRSLVLHPRGASLHVTALNTDDPTLEKRYEGLATSLPRVPMPRSNSASSLAMWFKADIQGRRSGAALGSQVADTRRGAADRGECGEVAGAIAKAVGCSRARWRHHAPPRSMNAEPPCRAKI
jgi:hypothetical protein